MKYSQNITHGSVVVKRGAKFILASRRTRSPVGVFMLESTIKGFTLDGSRFEFNIPRGIRTYGEAEVRSNGRME
ncbi:hypothetical protein LCGC14_0821090 [marine sediment metagenome]|uniref:Uncharacterized protein n=1 Tax=marine sediment metagenome TaxID=412755 RepID=A0A0F9PNF7_9ZZZZ